MQKTLGYICFLCLWLPLSALAQQPYADSLQLQEVQVTTSRFSQLNTGQKTQTFDSLQLVASRNHNLADLLSEQSQIFIKNFGPGTLSTPSFRGSAAEHTAVLWNGFNLQSPMYGQFDFALLPLEMTDEITVQYGGNGALFGSGAIGGAINLSSYARYGSGIHASLSAYAGSFDTYKQAAAVSYGSKKWFTTLRFFNHQAENNFSFNNTSVAGNPEMKQQNASLTQQALINEHYFKLTDKQEINLHFWYQNTLRHIPPTMSVPASEATQKDESYRTTAEWKWQQGRNLLFVRSALFYEWLKYTDQLKGDVGNNSSTSSISEIEYRIRQINHLEVNLGVNNTYNLASSSTYTHKNLNRFAQFVSLKYYTTNRKLSATASVRNELLNTDKWLPVMPSFGAEYTMNRSFKFFGNISRSYRVPTFNERFWNPGGNPDLVPESGWGEELSAQYSLKRTKVDLTAVATGFNRVVENWIIWLPAGSYWTPQNLRKVWSRGIETSVKANIRFNHWQLRLSSAFNFIRSTNQASLNAADSSIGKQLIYMPRISQQYQVSILYNRFYVSYMHTYTGMRYTSTDNLDAIEDYQLGNVKAGYTFSMRKMNMTLSGEINNVWNTSYQVIADRPMPGRNYLIGIQFRI